MSFDVPVLLLVYNRPDLTARVLERIARVRPTRLFIAADGPASSADAADCRGVRDLVRAAIDWPCKTSTAFSVTHRGCAAQVPRAIGWALSEVPELIVLEDDCLPHDHFFPFCRELLHRHRHDEGVMHISGTNLAPERSPAGCGYFFSRICLPPWGWATWRRAWLRYSPELPADGSLDGLLPERGNGRWRELLRHARGRGVTWDLQWNVALWRHGGLAAIPARNLVSNLGFDRRATLTRLPGSGFSERTTEALSWPLRPPRRRRPVPAEVLGDCLLDLVDEIIGAGRRRPEPARLAGAGTPAPAHFRLDSGDLQP